jgi:intracellular multiplication protein IcmJ
MRQNPLPKSSDAITPSLSLGFTNRWACQPIVGVKRQKWRMDDEHAALMAEESFLPVRDAVLKRDNFTCRFCAFKGSKYQEIHHVDGNHQNNDLSNLLTCCNLCRQVFHIGLCGQNGAGFFALLPELTQSEVNHISRTYFVNQLIGEQHTKDKLTGLYALFRARADNLKNAFGLDLSTPTFFAQVLSVIDETAFSERAEIMESLRLVPTKEAFKAGQLDYYAVNTRPQFAGEDWPALARQLMG